VISTPRRVTRGRSSCRRPNCFGIISLLISVNPVTLPPGRLRLATSPIWTGSPDVVKTIGIVAVSALAASAATENPGATMTSTLRRTISAAASARRSGVSSPHRNSIARLRPSTKPVSLKPFRNADSKLAPPTGVPPRRNPTTCIATCCCAAPRAATPPHRRPA
jgi:hypothetical protein